MTTDHEQAEQALHDATCALVQEIVARSTVPEPDGSFLSLETLIQDTISDVEEWTLEAAADHARVETERLEALALLERAKHLLRCYAADSDASPGLLADIEQFLKHRKE